MSNDVSRLLHDTAADPPHEVRADRVLELAHRRRSRRTVVVSALAVLAVVASVAKPSSLRSGPVTLAESAYRVDLAPPERLVVDGVEYERQGAGGVENPRLDFEDADALLVDVLVSTPAVPPACRTHEEVRILAQDATMVRVERRAYSAVNPSPSRVIECNPWADDMQTKAVRLDLGAPLAGRRLLDGTGTAIAVVDPRTLLLPTFLPPGYLMNGEHATIPVSSGSSTDVTSAYYYGRDRTRAVVITQGRTGPAIPRGIPTGEVTVRGHAGKLSYPTRRDVDRHHPDPAAQQCLTWRERPGLAVQVCNSPEGDARASALRAIAEGLRRPADDPALSVTPKRATPLSVTVPPRQRYSLMTLKPGEDQADLLSTYPTAVGVLVTAGVVAEGQACTTVFVDAPDGAGGGGSCGPAGVGIDAGPRQISLSYSSSGPDAFLGGSTPAGTRTIQITSPDGKQVAARGTDSGSAWGHLVHFAVPWTGPATVRALDDNGRELAQKSYR